MVQCKALGPGLFKSDQLVSPLMLELLVEPERHPDNVLDLLVHEHDCAALLGLFLIKSDFYRPLLPGQRFLEAFECPGSAGSEPGLAWGRLEALEEVGRCVI